MVPEHENVPTFSLSQPGVGGGCNGENRLEDWMEPRLGPRLLLGSTAGRNPCFLGESNPGVECFRFGSVRDWGGGRSGTPACSWLLLCWLAWP